MPYIRWLTIASVLLVLLTPAVLHAQSATINRVEISSAGTSPTDYCSLTDPSNPVCNPTAIPANLDAGIPLGSPLYLNVYYSVSGLQAGQTFAVRYQLPEYSPTGSQTPLANYDAFGWPESPKYGNAISFQAPDAGSGTLSGSTPFGFIPTTVSAVSGIPTTVAMVQGILPPISCQANEPYVVRIPIEIDQCTAKTGGNCTAWSPVPATAQSFDHLDVLMTNNSPGGITTAVYSSTIVADPNDAGYDVTYLVSTQSQPTAFGSAFIPGDVTTTISATYLPQLADGGLSDSGVAATVVSAGFSWDSGVQIPGSVQFGPIATTTTTVVDGHPWNQSPAVRATLTNTQADGGSIPYYSLTPTTATFEVHHLQWPPVTDNAEETTITFHVPANTGTLTAKATTAVLNLEGTCAAPTLNPVTPPTTTVDLRSSPLYTNISHTVWPGGWTHLYDDAGTPNPDGGYPSSLGFTAAQVPEWVGVTVESLNGGLMLNPSFIVALPAQMELNAAPGVIGTNGSAWVMTVFPSTTVYNAPDGTQQLQCCDGNGTCGASAVGTPLALPASTLPAGQHDQCFKLSYAGSWATSINYYFTVRLTSATVAATTLASPYYSGTSLLQMKTDNLATAYNAVLPANYLADGITKITSDTMAFENREGLLPACAVASSFDHVHYIGTNVVQTADGRSSTPFAIDLAASLPTTEGRPYDDLYITSYTNPSLQLTLPPQLLATPDGGPTLIGYDSTGAQINQPCSLQPNDGGTLGQSYLCTIPGNHTFLVPPAFDAGPSPLALEFSASAVAGASGQVLPIALQGSVVAQGALPAVYYLSINQLSPTPNAYTNPSLCSVQTNGVPQYLLEGYSSVDAGVYLASGTPYSYDIYYGAGSGATIGTEGTTIVDMFGESPNGAAFSGVQGGCLDAGMILSNVVFRSLQADGGQTMGDIYFSLDGGSALISAADGGPWVPAAQVIAANQLAQVKGVEVIVRSATTGVSGEFSPLDPPFDVQLQLLAPAVAREGQLCNESGVISAGAGQFNTTPITLVNIKPLVSMTNPCPAPASGNSPSPQCTVAELGTLTVNLVGHDSTPSSDSIAYHCINLPSGATLSASGQIQWSPGLRVSNSSPYVAHCWVTDQNGLHDDDGTDAIAHDHCSGDGSGDIDDGSGHCGQDVVLGVLRTDVAPLFSSISDQSISENPSQPLSFQASVTDPNCDAFTLSPGYLPPNMSCILDGGAANCGTITANCTWRPDYTQSGSWTANFTALEANGTDGGPLSTSLSVNINVANVDRAPVLDPIAPICVVAGSMVSIALDGGDPDMPITGYLGVNGDGGPNSDQIFYSTGALPLGASFNAGAQQLTWTPDNTQTGNHSISFFVTDLSGLDAGQTAAIYVDYLSLAPIVVNHDETVIEGMPLRFTTDVSEPEGDTDGYVCTMNPAQLPAGATYDSNSRQFNWTPGPGSWSASPYSVTTQCCAQLPASAPTPQCSQPACTSIETQLSVLRSKTPLVASASGTLQGNEGSAIEFQANATDMDCAAFTLAVTNQPRGMSCSAAQPTRTRNQSGSCTGLAQSMTCNWTPDYKQAGQYQLNIVAAESAGAQPATANAQVTLTVHNVDQSPTLAAIADQTVVEGAALNIQLDGGDPDMPLTGYHGVNATSPYADALDYSASGLPIGAQFAENAMAWTPVLGQWGDVEVAFVVADHDGPMTASQTAKIHVQYANIAPVISADATEHGIEGRSISFMNSVTDPRGNLDTCTMSGLPDGATYDALAHQFSWTPATGAASIDGGAYPVTINCCSVPPFGADPNPAEACASISTQIMIATGLHINAIAPLSGEATTPFTFTVHATDPSNAAISCTAAPLPAGATYAADTGLFNWTPGAAQTGSYLIQIACTDIDSSANEAVRITVTAAPVPPTPTTHHASCAGCAQTNGAPNAGMLPLGIVAALLIGRRRRTRCVAKEEVAQ